MKKGLTIGNKLLRQKKGMRTDYKIFLSVI